jgi:hypothetical protein
MHPTVIKQRELLLFSFGINFGIKNKQELCWYCIKDIFHPLGGETKQLLDKNLQIKH